jgi:hypothetical protein
VGALIHETNKIINDALGELPQAHTPAAPTRRRHSPKWATEQNVARAAAVKPPPMKTEQRALTFEERAQKAQLEDLKRTRFLPHIWTVATGVAGLAGWGFSAAIGAITDGAYGVTPILLGLVLFGVQAVVRYVKREVIPARFRRRTWFIAAASSAWITACSWIGATWALLGLLLIGELLFAVGFWRWQRGIEAGLTAPAEDEPAPAPTPEAAPIATPVTDLDTYIARWTKNVGGAKGCLPDSRLTGGEYTKHGKRFLLDLVPGKQTLSDALGSIERILSGLIDVSGTELILDQPAPTEGQRVNNAQLRLQILDRSPVKVSPWWTVPIFEPGHPGTCAIGLYADGDGHAHWTLFDDHGVWSGIIIGGTGSGKSSLLDGLVASARATGVLNIMFVDPQGGASSPAIRDSGAVVALGEAESVVALEALELDAHNREVFANAHGLSEIIPGAPLDCRRPGCPCEGRMPPGLIVVLDECDQTFKVVDPKTKKPVAGRWGVLAKRVRKLAVGFVVASQYSGLEVFGGSEMLRSNLAARNYVALYTRSPTSGRLIPGLPVNPNTLPSDQPGYGYASGAAARTAPFRGFWLPREGKPVPSELGEPPIRAGAAMALYPEPPLHPVDSPLREGFGDPVTAGVNAQEKAALELESIYQGRTVYVRQPVVETGDEFGEIPDVPPPVTTGAEPALVEQEQTVLDALVDGHTRTGDIVKACGEDTTTARRRVQGALRSLESAGWVVDGGHGVWLLSDGARESLQQLA